MKFRSIACVLLATCASSVTMAATHHNQAKVDRLVNRLANRADALQREVSSLRQQIQYLRRNQAHTSRHVRRQARRAVNPIHHHAYPHHLHPHHRPFQPADLGGMPITTSPYLGVRPQFDASDLLVMIPSAYQDLRLLQYRTSATKALHQQGEDLPSNPYLLVSGKVEAQVWGRRPFASASNRADIDLATAELDIAAAISPWATGYIGLDYDNSPAANGLTTSNSRMFLHKGFIVIGNLNKAPVYATIGQYYMPFGHYASAMIAAPLTMSFRTKARALGVTYAPHAGSGLYGSVYAFRSQANILGAGGINQGGADVEYDYAGHGINSYLGVSYISTVTDGEGILQTGGQNFGGFGGVTLQRQVPGYSIHGGAVLGHWSLVGEYVAAARDFSATDLTFDGIAAKPSAFNAEVGYNFKFFGKPGNIALGYQQSAQALGLMLPKRRYGIVLNTSMYKDTVESLEFHHDQAYTANDIASGTTGGTFGRVGGGVENVVIGQLGIYF